MYEEILLARKRENIKLSDNINLPVKNIIYFPHGLIGIDKHLFELYDRPENSQVKSLKSISDNDIKFTVLKTNNPGDYIKKEKLIQISQDLEETHIENLDLLLIVSGNKADFKLNLTAPIIINKALNTGYQILL